MPLQLTNDQLNQIAREYGTPVFVYHAERIGEQYQKLLSAFDGSDTKIFYAAKALTNINILKFIRSLNCRIDCSSVNEVKLSMWAGFSPTDILYTSSNVAFEEILEAKNLGVHINIDSLSNLRKFGDYFGSHYPVGVRIRPNIMAGGNLKISTGHHESKFGVALEHIPEVLKLMRDTGIRIRTLHIHTGSEIKDKEVFAKGIDLLLRLAGDFPDAEVLDFGGGFNVPYKPGEERTDIDWVGKKVREELAGYEKNTGRHLQAWFEPGKYIVSEAGYFITKVNVIKHSGTTTFAGVDSGLNHFIRPMFYGAYHEIENISNPQGEKMKYNVVGNICETDNFAEERMLPEIREDDLLVFRNAGAYCFEMSSHYNARFKPAELLVLEGKVHLIRKRDDMDDLLRGQITVL